jgi:hypothetical protein
LNRIQQQSNLSQYEAFTANPGGDQGKETNRKASPRQICETQKDQRRSHGEEDGSHQANS